MIIDKNGFIHHVFFWLKDPQNENDCDLLIAGLKKLSAASIIKDFHIGVPAATNRGVIDSSYAVSWLLLFNNKEEQDSYQVDPMHLQFVKECSHLWEKVIVYDTLDAGGLKH
jgi:Stress responsive A/B Barrel Domain